jgi:hypothetical protein
MKGTFGNTDGGLGFGEEGFDPKWPNGSRIAVSFVLNYEYVKGCFADIERQRLTWQFKGRW